MNRHTVERSGCSRFCFSEKID